MFGLPKKVDYGLELLSFLARQPFKKPVSLKKVAAAKKIAFKSLEPVALLLRQAGLVTAKEGRAGGYFLARKPARISVAEVVAVLAGPVQLGVCSGCPKAAVCGQKDIWGEVGQKVRKTIKGKTLKDLL